MVVMLALSTVFAQDSLPIEFPALNAQLYHPPADAQCTNWADDTTFAEDGRPIARLVFGYVRQPFVFVSDDGQRVPLLNNGVGMDLVAGYSFSRFRASVDVPLWLTADTKSSAAAASHASGIGDIALELKGVALDRGEAPIGLGFLARLTLPTGSVDAVPLGNPKVGWEAEAIVDKQVTDDLLLTANIGTRGANTAEMSNVTLGDQLFLRIGGGYAITEMAGASLDVSSNFTYASFGSGASTPIEGMVGGWGRINDWVVRGGVGTGLTRGIGAPAARLVVGVGYEPPLIKDSDQDGLSDKIDACPLDAEDPDGFEDADGCPELDNDKDGIADATDTCPLAAEDVDGWEDSDGCPDPNTHVRVRIFELQSGAALTGVVATVTGADAAKQTGDDDFEFDALPGSYTLHTNLAGYVPLDAAFDVASGPPVERQFSVQRDVAPGTLRLRVTDPDGNEVPNATFTLNDSAPEVLPDGGRIAKSLPPGGYVMMIRAEGFASSTFPATVREAAIASFNVVLQPAKVVVTRDKLDIKDKVYFETGKAIIKPESFKLLDEVAMILLDRPDILMVRIEGHTDSRGNDADNLRLSQLRAEAVRAYFIDKGVEEARLSAVGFGETKPINPAQTTAAYDVNRRVEFFIEKWADK